jgi:hypothetical protein
MGIYLGQLPPAEVARFKAELAETIVANFCYPRFFDHRSDSLQTRPIDRAKRQEVWLYLSSVDFTAWSRVDLTSTDFQHHIERLFIQFVQRNRSFFAAQGRRRMFDVRMSISTCAGAVAQRLRNHLTSQPITPPFGSPRSVLSWTATSISGHVEPGWEQIMAPTMELQRQLQEWRGEPLTIGGVVEPVAVGSRSSQSSRTASAEVPTPINAANGPAYRSTRPQQPQHIPASPANPMNPAASTDYSIVAAQQSTMPTPPITTYGSQPGQNGRNIPNPMAAATAPMAPGAPRTSVQTPSGSMPASPVVPHRPSGNLPQPGEQNIAARQSGGSMRARVATSPTPAAQRAPVAEPSLASASASSIVAPVRFPEAQPQRTRTSPLPGAVVPTSTGPHPARTAPTSAASFSANTVAVNNSGQREVFAIGEDDVAIFEQMRYQLLLWLRIEAVSSGLEFNGQGPTQLIEMLRQQPRQDETRLQVVSTLLNLAAQVIKTGTVSVLDYKQALMFHLMHTKRP